MVHTALNDLEGVTCNRADGALYAFPRIRLSDKAKRAAEGKGVPADEFYCLAVRGDVTGELRCAQHQKRPLLSRHV